MQTKQTKPNKPNQSTHETKQTNQTNQTNKTLFVYKINTIANYKNSNRGVVEFTYVHVWNYTSVTLARSLSDNFSLATLA